MPPWSLPRPRSPPPPPGACLLLNCHASNFLSRLKGHQDSVKLPVHAKPKCLWSRAQSGLLNWIPAINFSCVQAAANERLLMMALIAGRR